MFTEEEFKNSFDKVDKDGSGFITANEVEDLLFATYGFPPLEEEVNSMLLYSAHDKFSVYGRFRHKQRRLSFMGRV